jgi:hypothetical protein
MCSKISNFRSFILFSPHGSLLLAFPISNSITFFLLLFPSFLKRILVFWALVQSSALVPSNPIFPSIKTHSLQLFAASGLLIISQTLLWMLRTLISIQDLKPFQFGNLQKIPTFASVFVVTFPMLVPQFSPVLRIRNNVPFQKS